MAKPIRHRFRVLERRHENGLQTISLVAALPGGLSDAGCGVHGGGSISLCTTDPEMAARFPPGRTFYVDFTEV